MPVPAEKVHPSIRARGVALQYLFDEAHAFDVLLPVERGAEAKARDGIRHGDLGDPLALVFTANRVLGGRLRRHEVFLDRHADGRQAKTVFTDAMKKLDDVPGFGERWQGQWRPSGAIVNVRDVGIG